MMLCGSLSLMSLGAEARGVDVESDNRAEQATRQGRKIWTAATELCRRFRLAPLTEELAVALADGGTNLVVELGESVEKGLYADVRKVSVTVYVAADEVRKNVVLQFELKGAGMRQCVYDESWNPVWAIAYDPKETGEGEKVRPCRVFEFNGRGNLIRFWNRDVRYEVLALDRGGKRLEREVRHMPEHRLFVELREVLSGSAVDKARTECRIDAWLSASLQEIALTNGNAMVVKTRTWGDEEWIRIGTEAASRQMPQGTICVVRRGEPFVFRRGESSSRLILLGDDDIGRLGLNLPPEFSTAGNLVYFACAGLSAVFSPVRQQVFLPREYVVRDFPFPFHSNWSSEEEYRRRIEGDSLGSRKGVVLRMSKKQRRLAEALHWHAVQGPGREKVVSALQGKGWTNILITVESASGMVRAEKINEFLVLVGGEGSGRSVKVIRFKTEGSNGHSCFFRFDEKGRPRWNFYMDREAVGLRWRLDGQRAFEFGEDGLLLRALSPGVNPLLLVSGRSSYSTGDSDSLRRFFSDLSNAVRGSTVD